ncbi:MAG TPA: nickel pincer cofactor biosynthesis protein LarB [Nitrospiria bacterium]|nr:nickel pincer cofactor biosynthesis protein LarB [Nitrospiria bacterium]
MTPARLKNLLTRVQKKEMTVSEAVFLLKHFPSEELGFATLDHHRSLRQGFPEVIFCQGKSPRQVLGILKQSQKVHSKTLATRVSAELFTLISKEFPEARYNETGKIVLLSKTKRKNTGLKGRILILTAGTSDLYAAEEARETAETFGSRTETLYDVGVAGIHRLTDKKKALSRARVIIVIAGMDGVLPSVVGGLTDRPVIAVPTSQGYGAAFGGVAALLTMLNSCSAGIGVMNIDNGFGAAVLAHRINTLPKGGGA